MLAVVTRSSGDEACRGGVGMKSLDSLATHSLVFYGHSIQLFGVQNPDLDSQVRSRHSLPLLPTE